jgi:superfamily II RNA helicase
VPSLDLGELFPFELDKFQHDAIAALNADKSVVVCAPTGSGKTLIGEYAIYKALAKNCRVFYTTPLKALSNQKLRDFRARFGEENVGLLTGDISVNREAPVLVMTTEIFRNMLYGTPIGEVGTSLVGVEVVVLDECHYMNDRQRGTVWEESIIYCPPEVQLVALSATVDNSQQLTDWIAKVHGKTELIYSDFRPIPLQFHFCNPKGLFPLLDASEQKINPRLKPNTKNKPKDASGKPTRHEAPNIGFTLTQLRQRDMLPAIYFIFSRRGCDQAVTGLGSLSLVNEDEAKTLKLQIDAFLAANPEAGRTGQIDALYCGIAAHHAGILPAWKGLVEELFQQGLIKVVFATETLAAGINMPARTTVVSSLSKRTDRGHRLLTASEFLQMAGRAGRRGMDEIGYVVTVQTPFEGAREAAYLATSRPDPLVSQFTPSYGMVLNLLQTHSIEEVKALIERSFGQYLSDIALAPQAESLEGLTYEIDRLEKELAAFDLKLFEVYEKLRDRLREERRLLKTLSQQAEEQRLKDLATYIPFVLTGSLITIKSPKGNLTPGVIAAKVPGSGKFPWLVVLGQDNCWYVLTSRDVLLLGDVWTEAELNYPPELTLKPGHSLKGDEQSQAIATQLPRLAIPDSPPEVLHQQAQTLAIEAKLHEHPVSKWEDKAGISKKARKLGDLQRQLEFQQNLLTQRRGERWEEFLSLMSILQDFGCIEFVTNRQMPMSSQLHPNQEVKESYQEDSEHRQPQPTPFGQTVAAIRGDNELWLGLVLASGELDDLAPHHLATVCAAIVTENSRPDTWMNLGLSPIVDEVLGGLRGIRRQLFQLQRRHEVVIPIWLETDLVGLVEQWALEMEWTELCRHTSLDEGDIVRMMRRTIDLLCQIPYAPFIPETLRQSARQAIQLMDRFPVSEII